MVASPGGQPPTITALVNTWIRGKEMDAPDLIWYHAAGCGSGDRDSGCIPHCSTNMVAADHLDCLAALSPQVAEGENEFGIEIEGR